MPPVPREDAVSSFTPSQEVSNPGRRASFSLALAAAVIVGVSVHLLSAGWHVLFGALNTDEGFYAVVTRSVAEGEMPYRDFGFTQPPLTPYVNSVPLRLAGYGLFSQRLVNGLWGALALALAVAWLAPRTRSLWSLIFALGFSLSAPWMYFIHLGKTYGLTTLLVMLGTGVFLAAPAGPRRSFLVGLLGVFGIATRLPAAPFFGLIGLAVLWPGRRPAKGELWGLIGGVAVGCAVAVLPFAIAAPANAWYWIVEFHRISVPNKQWHLAWQELVTLAPAVWLMAVSAVGLAWRRRRVVSREAIVFLAAGVTLAANLLPGGAYEEYAVPFLLPLALIATAWLYDGTQMKPLNRGFMFILLVVVHWGTAPLVLRQDFPDRRGSLSSLLTPNAPPYNRELPGQLFAARRLIDQTVPPDGPFIGTNLILAAETGRFVPPELRMGSFAYTGELSHALAAQRHFATGQQLGRWLANAETKAIGLFPSPQLNYGWSLPSFDPTAQAVREQWWEILRRDYTVVMADGQFLILVRKPEVP